MATPTEWTVDGFRTRVVYQPHEGRTYVERTQPNEAAILRENIELQKQEQREMDWARWVGRIPELYLDTYHPGWRRWTGTEKARELHKILLAHPEFRVVPKVKL
jgi:hypothetical protein